MTLVVEEHQPKSTPTGEPVWEIAELFPGQGLWSEGEYLGLFTRRLVEFDNGVVEVLPMPKRAHQVIALLLYELLKAFVIKASDSPGWLVLVAPYKLRIPTKKFREPDVLYLTANQNARGNEDFAVAAELVMEVVSPDDPKRDYVIKRADYAAAGVPEYWIVDHAEKAITVLRLEGDQYVEHGRFGPGERATSHRLPGFEVGVEDVLAAAR